MEINLKISSISIFSEEDKIQKL